MSKKVRKCEIVELTNKMLNHRGRPKNSSKSKKTNQIKPKNRMTLLSRGVRARQSVEKNTSHTKKKVSSSSSKKSRMRVKKINSATSTASDPAIAELIRQVVSDVNVTEAMEQKPALRQPTALLREFDRAVANLNAEDLDFDGMYDPHENDMVQEEDDEAEENERETVNESSEESVVEKKSPPKTYYSCVFCGKPAKQKLKDIQAVEAVSPVSTVMELHDNNFATDHTNADNYESDQTSAYEDDDLELQNDDDEDCDDNDDEKTYQYQVKK